MNDADRQILKILKNNNPISLRSYLNLISIIACSTMRLGLLRISIISLYSVRLESLCLHPYVTKQYNLVLVEGRWRYSAGKVTADLSESNSRLLARDDCLTPGSAPGPTIGEERENSTFTFYVIQRENGLGRFYSSWNPHGYTSGTLPEEETDRCSIEKILFQAVN